MTSRPSYSQKSMSELLMFSALVTRCRCSVVSFGLAICLSCADAFSTGFSGLGSQWIRSGERTTRISYPS